MPHFSHSFPVMAVDKLLRSIKIWHSYRQHNSLFSVPQPICSFLLLS